MELKRSNSDSYFPLEIEKKDRRTKTRLSFISKCVFKTLSENVPIATYSGTTKDISIGGIYVSLNKAIQNIPIYMVVQFENCVGKSFSGYIDSPAYSVQGECYSYGFKFDSSHRHQQSEISTVLQGLDKSMDRRKSSRTKASATEINEQTFRHVEHKSRILTFNDRRQIVRRLISESLIFPNRRRADRRKVERRGMVEIVQPVTWTVSDQLSSRSERLLQFYLKANFIYREKRDFLLPIKEEVVQTLEKLFNSKDDTCKFIFVTDEKEDIKGSVMAVQYTNDTWMVQHIVVQPGLRLLAKGLVLDALAWSVKNRGMYYFINYFQDKTRWAYKTYHAVMDEFGENYMSIDSCEYVSALLSELPLQAKDSLGIEVLITEEKDYKFIYSELTKTERPIVLAALGLKESSYDFSDVKKRYENIGVTRDRIYFTAREGNRIVGFCFVDISSYGISLSLLFNTFHIFIFNEFIKERIYSAFVERINKTLRIHKKVYSLGLVKTHDTSIFEALGYVRTRKYSRYIYSRDKNQFQEIYNFVNLGRRHN